MAKAIKNRASKQPYISPKQGVLEGFETPFHQLLDTTNRWVVLAQRIPWDDLASVYNSQLNNLYYGAEGINARVAIGSMIIKHICNLDDRETVMQIQENVYMQYFLGYSSFSNEAPFDPSLFVDLRKRLGLEQINAINEKILNHSKAVQKPSATTNPTDGDSNTTPPSSTSVTHGGELIVDATACPQDISYPTDLKLLNDARELSEQLIDELCINANQKKKPRTYREKARKFFLKTAQKKTKTQKEIYAANKKQLNFLKRNIISIHKLLDKFEAIPLNEKMYKYLLVIQTFYEQQHEMHKNKTHTVAHRIVSIHQPHVRPIVRGKTNAKVEFGAKINVSLMNGYAFLDDLEWEAYNEGTRLKSTVEKYKERFGFYPQSVLADKIYCNRDNRSWLNDKNIQLKAKPLGRPKAVSVEHVRPGERNPIEGKFGQAKTAYGMDRIMARLQQTSESWIALIVMVLNLVKLAGEVPYCLMDFMLKLIATYFEDNYSKQYLFVRISDPKIYYNRKSGCLT